MHFLNQNNEKIEHIFCHCFVTKVLWNDLNTIFENHLSLYDLTRQAPFFALAEKYLVDSILQNDFLSGSYGFVCLMSLLLEIKKINCLEKKIAEANANKHKSYLLK